VAGIVKDDPLGGLALAFASLSLVAIGGANAVVPALHDLSVERNSWLTDRDFAEYFALANAAPGPNVLLVTLIGFKVAGIAGAFVATGAMCGPSSALAFAVSRVWTRLKDSPWRKLAERGLAPVTIGLVFASAFTLTLAAGSDLVRVAITLAAAAAILLTRLNPLWVLTVAAAAGFAGLG